MEPDAVINHEAKKILRGSRRVAAVTTHSGAPFAAGVHRNSEGGLIQPMIGLVDVLQLQAIVGVEAIASGHAQVVGSPVVVAENRNRASGRHKICVPTPGLLLNLP